MYSDFCDELRKELGILIKTDAKMDCTLWIDVSPDTKLE
jgi:hypothetical protein